MDFERNLSDCQAGKLSILTRPRSMPVQVCMFLVSWHMFCQMRVVCTHAVFPNAGVVVVVSALSDVCTTVASIAEYCQLVVTLWQFLQAWGQTKHVSGIITPNA